MFDTIRLYKQGKLKDFNLSDEHFRTSLDIQGAIEKKFNSFSDEFGNKVVVEYDEIKQGLNISFSAQKIANKTQIKNFCLSDKDKLISELYKILEKKVDVDFEKMRVSRLDICSNIETEHKVKYYLQALSNIVYPIRNYKKDYYQDESLTIYNKSRRFLFYDKIAEIEQKRLEKLKSVDKNRNIFRYEIQNKRGRDIKTLLKKDYLFQDLFTESVFLDCIKVQKNQYKTLFLNKNEQFNLFESDKKIIEILLETSKRNVALKFLSKNALENGVSFQYLETLLSDYYTKRGLRKMFKELKELVLLSVKTQDSLVIDLFNKFEQLSGLVA